MWASGWTKSVTTACLMGRTTSPGSTRFATRPNQRRHPVPSGVRAASLESKTLDQAGAAAGAVRPIASAYFR
jgi:hypothetical protein